MDFPRYAYEEFVDLLRAMVHGTDVRPLLSGCVFDEDGRLKVHGISTLEQVQIPLLAAMISHEVFAVTGEFMDAMLNHPSDRLLCTLIRDLQSLHGRSHLRTARIDRRMTGILHSLRERTNDGYAHVYYYLAHASRDPEVVNLIASSETRSTVAEQHLFC